MAAINLPRNMPFSDRSTRRKSIFSAKEAHCSNMILGLPMTRIRLGLQIIFWNTRNRAAPEIGFVVADSPAGLGEAVKQAIAA